MQINCDWHDHLKSNVNNLLVTLDCVPSMSFKRFVKLLCDFVCVCLHACTFSYNVTHGRSNLITFSSDTVIPKQLFQWASSLSGVTRLWLRQQAAVFSKHVAASFWCTHKNTQHLDDPFYGIITTNPFKFPKFMCAFDFQMLPRCHNY